ncbi:two-component regulator propeller domain-containing protein [Sphingomonas sp. YR710]|uniref:ligand-binding sensor domain-containing protein n=1 Tax=Sphingomonas sp. YR710 TaxID=1882773 RepID=UPI000B828663|nr:ligand-binding sensor domain-containing diguanylate cyclase [Sphingomonas sp. YR710]
MLAGDPGLTANRWDGLATTVFRNYGRDEGLPHPVPTALAQDHAGFIWIGTQGGLARWDGYRFVAYKANPAVPGSLPDDFIQTLHVDPAGRLWIGTSAGGLARFDAARGRFVAVPIGPSTGRTHIGAIADDGHGGLWIGSDTGLHQLNPIDGTVRTLYLGLPGGRVQALLRDRAGALWIGTASGLVRRATGSQGFAAIPLATAGTGVSSLLEDRDGRIWIGTVRQGLFVIDRPNARPRRIGTGSHLPSASVSTICIAGPHEIWAGLRGDGIMAIDTVTGTVRPIRHDRMVPNSLAHNDVWALLRDNAGSVWVGGIGGLGYHPHDAGLIATVFGSQERSGGFSASDILSVMATRSGRIWVGYLDGGADVIDPLRGRVGALRPDPTHPAQALPPDAMFAMAEGRGRTIYLGTRRGLYVTDPDARAARLVALPGREPHLSVTALTFDAGLLWVGGEDDGLWGVVPGRGAGDPGRLVFGPAESAKLSDKGIDVILRGTGPDLWVGTRNGLSRIDLATRAIETIAADPSDHDALPGRFVVALLIDRKGRLWVGTFGGGLAVMTGRSADGRPRFHRIGLAQGLPHLNIDSLQMDGTGTIWAGTDNGLARIDPSTFAIRTLRRADGAPLIDYFAGAGATDTAGEALFGAKGGLTIVRPGRLPRWTFQPPIVATDARIGGAVLPVGPLNGASAVAPLTLTPATNSLAVEFAALDFSAPEQNRYAYRLDGFDRDWTQTTADRRLAVYTNLPPGAYSLRLRGTNRDGRWTGRDLSIPIRVLPAWYQRLWFRLMMAAAFVAAIIALVRWRTAWLRRRQAELERQVADRTTDLRAANEQLAQLAITDPLTGCANRRHFMERAQELTALARRHGTPLSMAILDLDDFKRVNDEHGHPGGDAALIRAGHIITAHLRSTDLVGRIGGEEFALLIPHTTAPNAGRLAERLRAEIADGVVEVDGARIGITASIGVTQLRPDEDFDNLYIRTDAVLYTAKQAGRNRVEMVPAAE